MNSAALLCQHTVAFAEYSIKTVIYFLTC